MSAPVTRAEVARLSNTPVELQVCGTKLLLVADTREQRPYGFQKYDCDLIQGTLPSGDYAIAGLEHRAVIERKSLEDLVSCLMGAERERFERELARLRAYDMAAVIIEASIEDVRQHRYRSRMKPHAALQSILAFQVRYGVPFVWAGSREGGEYVTYWTLAKFVREQGLRCEVVKAHDGPAEI